MIPGSRTKFRNMKTALLLSGWPRFHAEFDEQLSNLHGSEIDWIVVLWKNFPSDVDLTLNAALTPSWMDTVKNEDDARAWLKARMPANHNLAHFSYIDWNDLPDYVRRDYPNQVPGTVPEAIFRQFWMFKQTYAVAESIGSYDLILRSRADTSVSTPIHLDQIHKELLSDPLRLVIPSNNRQGLSWNDLFCIGLPETMKVYATAVDHFNEVYDMGVTMHPENIVSHVLRLRGLHWNDDGIIASIRQLGKYLTPTFVKGQKYYEADFGRW